MKNKASQFVFFLLILTIDILFPKEVHSQNTTISVNVGVVLNMEIEFGKMGLNCINMALADFYNAHPDYRTRIVLHTRDSKNDVVAAAAAALDLIKNVQVEAILGPDSSMQTDFVIDLGDKAHVPIITFSATSPSLSFSRSPYFFRAALNDSSQVQAISSIIKAFGWREVVPIYVDNEYGQGVVPYLTDAFQEINADVPYQSVIPPLATDDQIEKELYKLMTMQTRVFVVHMLEDLGARVFGIAEKIGMMSDGYAWIVTNGVADRLNFIKPSVIVDSMQGVLGVKVYVPESKQLDEFKLLWERNFSNLHLSIFTLWAYDATFALAMAIEKVNTTTFTYLKNTNTSNAISDLETIGISKTGLELQRKLSTTRFRGLAGDFNLVDGQLQSSVFQFINVIGNGQKGVGFWIPGSGISRKLKFTNTSLYTTSKDDLVTIVWPGETALVPKGWVIPTNGKRLKIGVPVKDGFRDFVKVTMNASTNSVDGYCIAVFKAVMQAMPYDVPYDFVPFAQPNGSGSGSYNDLIYQIYLQKYDAVVGDVTIVANRTNYVDFSLPYTESGVSMIVSIKDKKLKSAFIFLQPWTGELWLTTACFFVFIGFVIWVLEHRINEDFRGPPSHQAGMILWFSFSTMVFAHKEKVLSNLARFVIIVWVFVVLILTQSYTASLTTMLTVQQLKPTFTDVNELIKRGEYVGYQKGSFVLGLLKKMNFDEKKLIEYNSPEECDELFSNGSANGGIAAAFDETPYMRLFLGRYCSKYTMVGPVYKTAGFGFAFPRGSPLISDVSRAILKVTEGDEMVQIEKAWFGTQTTCEDSSAPLTSNRLGTDSFWGLFLMAGAASISAFVIYTILFLYEHRHILARPSPQHSIWEKMIQLCRHFDNKDLSSHTFRKSEVRGRVGHDGINHTAHNSPNNFPQSPSTYSTHTNNNFVFFGENGSGTTSHDFGEASPNGQTLTERVGHDGINRTAHNSPNNFLQSPSTYSTRTNNNFVFFGENGSGTPTHEFGKASPSGQTLTERVWSVELVSIPNEQERHGDITEIPHESN